MREISGILHAKYRTSLKRLVFKQQINYGSMPSRIIVYKTLLVAWLLLSGTIGYIMVVKMEELRISVRDGDDKLLERMLENRKLGERVSVDLEGFQRWISSGEDRLK